MLIYVLYMKQYLEVICKSSGKISRYAAGTKAGFAVNLINRKLGNGNPLALHIEAVKEGEEPINFGPNAVLVDYGKDWKLQTVTEVDYAGIFEFFQFKFFYIFLDRVCYMISFSVAYLVYNLFLT